MKYKSTLYNKLIEYNDSDYYAFHMPGHKRKCDVIESVSDIDITEIDGFDNLHNANGILYESMQKASEYYGSKESFYLINGSTCGNLAAISAVACRGNKIIIGRNSHKSIYNAAELLDLDLVYIYPDMVMGEDIFGSYNPRDVEDVIKLNSDAKAVVITSPTYEGIVSDVERICKIAHGYGIPIIVDAAHGAHFTLCEYFPQTAIRCGADIVIESLHKTLPSLTQTAILHFNSEIIDINRVKKYLGVYQSSSPSYVMMASIANCVEFMEKEGQRAGKLFFERLCETRKNIDELQSFSLLERHIAKSYDYDISKLVILVDNPKMSGRQLKDILREEYRIELEMAAPGYVIAMTSVCDSDEGFSRLVNALSEIDLRLGQANNNYDKTKGKLGKIYSLRNEKVCRICETSKEKGVSDKFVCLYPPGIPLVVPGEIPAKGLMSEIEKYKELGYEVIEWR